MTEEEINKKDDVPEDKPSVEAVKSPSKDYLNKARENPWIVSTIVLGLVLVIVLIVGGSNFGMTGNVVSSGDAGQNLVDFIKTQTGKTAEIVSIEREDFLYSVIVKLDENEIPVHLTLDGKNLLNGGLVPLTVDLTPSDSGRQTPPPADVPKSDKPIVEAFVSPYCPYGLQFEKGLILVYDLLKDKADISIKLMNPTHMQEEIPEIKKELCILEEYDKDIYFDYLRNIVYNNEAAVCYNEYHGINLQTNEQIDSENKRDGEYYIECMASFIDDAMKESGIDKNKIESCVAEKGQGLMDGSTSYVASQGDVSGSPTLKINGIKISSGRSPDLIKQTICSAFNNVPEECSQVLLESTFSPGIGASENLAGQVSGVC
ncbi:hypothetical protein DRJ16_03100 [Candidatus Woesearchaeota archaeon]|nr:MAG: hypothetical protein DRJ16_03100 [Candidatus Woesearchaeota archaeon]